MIGPYHHAIGDFGHRNLGCPGQDFPEFAGVFGIQMLHKYKRHSGFDGELAQQFGESLQPARGRADTDDGKRCRTVAADRMSRAFP